MTLITRIPGVTFTDATLPKLYRDAIITAGTKFCFDALDNYSYPKQETPTPGTDVWTDLTPNAATASFGAGGAPFSAGFMFNPVAFSSQKITLPASGKAASNAAGFMFGMWFKHLAVSPQIYSGIAGMADSTAAASCQYAIYAGTANSGEVRAAGLGSEGMAVTPAINSINQMVVACKKLENGTYSAYFWRNGALVNTINNGVTSISPSIAATNPYIGYVNGNFTSGSNFKALRCYYDDTSTLADVSAMTALVLADYNANVNRFS